MPTVTCPACAYAREVDADRLAPAPLKLTCPSCRGVFVVDGAALLGVNDSLELDWGDREPRPVPGSAPVAAPAPEAAAMPVPGANLDRFRLLGATPPARPMPTPMPEPQAVAALPPSPERFDPAPAPALRLVEDSAPTAADRFSFDDLRVNAAALPIALGVAVLAKVLWFPGVLLDYFRVWLHEFGHALVAWLGSRAATPLALMPGVGWASVNPTKSPLVFVCFLFLLGVLAVRGWRARSWFLVSFAAALLALQLWFSLVATTDGWEQVHIWAGVGGELILSTLLIAAFYYRMPDRLRWDFVRFVALVVAMYAFVAAFWLWARAVNDHGLIPYGTGLWGSDDENGDMNRLREFGWSPNRIARTYLVTALLCAGAIAGHYLFFLRRGLARSRRP